MTFCTHRLVEFRDTDAAGIVHFSAFFPMMEAAEHEMLRSLGLSVMPRRRALGSDRPLDDEPLLTWPRVAASCQYKSAAHFEDNLKISVNVVRIGKTSVQYRFVFTRGDDLIAEGELTAVCCRLPDDHSAGGLQKVAIPDRVREILATHQ